MLLCRWTLIETKIINKLKEMAEEHGGKRARMAGLGQKKENNQTLKILLIHFEFECTIYRLAHSLINRLRPAVLFALFSRLKRKESN